MYSGNNTTCWTLLLPSLSLYNLLNRRFDLLLSPLQHLGAHLNQPVLSLAVGKRRNGGDCLVDVVFGQRAGLRKACAGEYNLAGLVSNRQHNILTWGPMLGNLLPSAHPPSPQTSCPPASPASGCPSTQKAAAQSQAPIPDLHHPACPAPRC